MKVVLLAGGLGTRLSEETKVKPKPMVEIGGMPILWHIMKIYSHYGFNEFVICLGYKGEVIKDYFYNYYINKSNFTIDLEFNTIKIQNTKAEPWKITLVDTGSETMTGGRVKRIKEFIGNDTFMLTYGDGLCDINISELLKFHNVSKKICTLTRVQTLGRFGILDLDNNNLVNSFLEKPKGDGNWINGGFFVCEPEIFNYLENDSTILEREPMEMLASEGNLISYPHDGFWKPMDSLRDKIEIEELWQKNIAPWKIWNS